ncbi:MAG: hypothetical protein Q9217_005507 [Psora testacea]
MGLEKQSISRKAPIVVYGYPIWFVTVMSNVPDEVYNGVVLFQECELLGSDVGPSAR